MQTIESVTRKLNLLDCSIINTNDFGIGYSQRGKDSMDLILVCKGKTITKPEFIGLNLLYIYDDFIIAVDKDLKTYAFVKDIEENLIDKVKLKGYTTSLKMTDPVESRDGSTVVMALLVRGNMILINKDGKVVDLETVTRIETNTKLPTNYTDSYCDSISCDSNGDCILVIKYRNKPRESYKYWFDKDLNLVNHKFRRY